MLMLLMMVMRRRRKRRDRKNATTACALFEHACAQNTHTHTCTHCVLQIAENTTVDLVNLLLLCLIVICPCYLRFAIRLSTIILLRINHSRKTNGKSKAH